MHRTTLREKTRSLISFSHGDDHNTEMESSDESLLHINEDESTGWGWSDDESEADEAGDWVEPVLLTKITYDQATEEAWTQAKYEILVAQNNILHTLSLENKASYNLPILSRFVISKIYHQIRSLLRVSSSEVMSESSFTDVVLTFFLFHPLRCLPLNFSTMIISKNHHSAIV